MTVGWNRLRNWPTAQPLVQELRERHCTKHRHSRGSAEAQLRSIQKRAHEKASRDADHLGVYECRRGCPRGTWHVGHRTDR